MEVLTNTTNRTSAELIDLEHRYNAHNYHPLPVVLDRGEGVFVWDVEGKRYYDFLSAYSAVNQGHCHPRIIQALVEQAHKLTLTSRAFHNSQLGIYAEFITHYFGYDRVLPMNTGVEAVETAVKLARRWGYRIKGVPDGQAKIIVVDGNFHGRTLLAISASTDPSSRRAFGPYLSGFITVPYDDIDALEQALQDPHVVGFLVEPIQGEAGVNVPSDDYLPRAFQLCQQHQVLFLADEVQTGIARTGRLLCCDHFGIKPDLLILGKALSGGVVPASAVLSSDKVMLTLRPGEHGSTFGGNPLACAVAMEALRVVKDESLASNAEYLGQIFRARMESLHQKRPDLIKGVRGKGLLNAVLINDAETSETAWNICLAMAENGLLAKPTHGNIIRFAPPLVMTEEQMNDCCSIIEDVFTRFEK